MARVAAKLLLLAGALALGAGACKDAPGGGGDAGGGGAANAAAGRVVDLIGSVSAARAGAKVRSLGRGDPVYRDDTVTTAADSSVTILLAHNRARWSLAADQSRRVDRSAAWRAEPASARSAFDDEDVLPTSSAGRHSEPQVGDTRATAPTPPADAPASETRMAEAEEAAEPPPAPRAPRRQKKSVAQEPTERAKGDVPAAESSDGMGLALGAAPVPGRAGSRGSSGAGAEAKPSDSADRWDDSKSLSVPGDRRAVLVGLRVTGARKRAELAAELVEGLGGAARICSIGARTGGTVAVSFRIGPAGDVTRVRVKGPPPLLAQVGGCLRKEIAELRVPARSRGSTRVRQSIRFEVP